MSRVSLGRNGGSSFWGEIVFILAGVWTLAGQEETIGSSTLWESLAVHVEIGGIEGQEDIPVVGLEK